ncbi:MAG: hypothetical protein HRU17_06110 [Polyangiaceae bacterium]|nr:hypothetical protein [Polyangiaceae bacterium]
MRTKLPTSAQPGDDVVVTLHGALATAGVFRPLKRVIEAQERVWVASLTLNPALAIEDAAIRLGDLVAELPPGVNCHLIGHSLGGIIVRWYVQQVLPAGPEAPTVVQTFSLGAPFGGASVAKWIPLRQGRDLVAQSALLSELARGADRSAIPHCSFVGEDDRTGKGDGLSDIGDRIVVPDCGHNGLLFHPLVGSEVVSRILQSRQGDAAPSEPC